MATMRGLCAVVLCTLLCAASAQDFINTKVKRTFQAAEHTVSVKIDFTVEALKPTNTFIFSLPEAEAAHVAHMRVKSGATLAVKKLPALNGHVAYQATLSKTIAEGDSANIHVTVWLTHFLTPFPEEIEQRDSQLVILAANLYVATPYETKSQETWIELPSGTTPQSYTKTQPVKFEGRVLKYGPYTDVKPYTLSPIKVHYVNNAPFATFTQVLKEIEVSHWGNVAVEEQIDMAHTGAKLKGGFSRLDYQMSRGPSSSFRSLFARLPETATDIYYRDIIGNISTSAVRDGDSAVEMEIETRFPMFGGWKTQWYQGYNLPASKFISVANGDEYTLSIDLGVPFENVVTDKINVRVILPEGAQVVSVKSKVDIKLLPEERRFTYLDTPLTGRTVVTLEAFNLVDQSNDKLTVVYKVPHMFLLREPLLLVSAFFIAFFAYSAFSRVNLNLSAEKKSD